MPYKCSSHTHYSPQCPCAPRKTGLGDCHGAAFEELYTRYEREGRFRRQVRAQDLWFAILDSQIETGTPYMLVSSCVGAVLCSCCWVGGWLGKWVVAWRA